LFSFYLCKLPDKFSFVEIDYKNCQRCGMPLKKDEKGGGNNATTNIPRLEGWKN